MKDVVDVLRWFTTEEGLNVPASTMAKYCNLSHSAITNYIRGDSYPSEKSEMKLWQGFEKYKKDIIDAMNGIYNYHDWEKENGIYNRTI